MMNKKLEKYKEDLRTAQKRYQKVCDKLEQLNDEAFLLEQEITLVNTLLKKEIEKCQKDII